ncbi:unnamed protein product [Clonostachys rosea f. rosea IK726]|uniref:GH64 domain-containing protein n=2 Tax=Bionectria ochroleuca TaxID=29856 RepID=A0A0B7KJW2_BIOOC|nr:unnamed protein product [Clonostachys rosea f. rosea IK726]
MRFITFTLGLLGSSVTAYAAALPRTPNEFTEVNPGGFEDLVVTKDNTLNGTRTGDELIIPPPSSNADFESIGVSAVAASLPMKFVNNYGADLVAYVQGKDSSGAAVFILSDGSLLYPSSGGSTTPVQVSSSVVIKVAAGQTLSMTIPIAISSARVYFASAALYFGVVSTGSGDGIVQPSHVSSTDPSAGINWGFVELTLNTDGSLFANISYVDFLGLPLGIALSVKGGGTQTAYGVSAGSVAAVCSALKTQGNRDGYPWAGLCQTNSNNPVRILSPYSYSDIDSSGFSAYWDSYVNSVWSKYTSQDLILNTQTSYGSVACRVSGSTLTCAQDNRSYSKPSARDIWGCNSGPFAIQSGDNAVHVAVVPRLCAAFVRSTLLLSGGNIQPSLGQSYYYTVDPTNYYSKAVHAREVDGKGYAFPYDDVNPDGNENASGTVSHATPDTLTVYVGSPP